MRILIVFLLPIFMFAHSLSVTASYEDGELYVESMFGNGDSCKNCPFSIKHNGNEIHKGTLDKNGLFEGMVKLKTPFDVKVDGGMGHSADVSIDGNEFGEKQEADNSNNSTSSINTTINSIDETKIRQIIKSELNKQNAKIQVMIEKNKSMTEQMLVGLGYILGIFGLWQLFARRQER